MYEPCIELCKKKALSLYQELCPRKIFGFPSSVEQDEYVPPQARYYDSEYEESGKNTLVDTDFAAKELKPADVQTDSSNKKEKGKKNDTDNTLSNSPLPPQAQQQDQRHKNVVTGMDSNGVVFISKYSPFNLFVPQVNSSILESGQNHCSK